MTAETATPHRWRFYRVAGVEQVRLDTGDDIFHLDELDQKLWVALSCPVKGLQFDERTLALLDADGDGHVRPPEILEAVRWLRTVLKHGDGLLRRVDGVPLAEIRTDTAKGKALLAGARHVLKSLGRAEATSITVADAVTAGSELLRARWNGDGVVPPESIEDAEVRAAALDVVACTGGEADRSGAQGISRATVAAFFDACDAYSAWARRGNGDAELLPLGDATPAAAAALRAVRAKVDDWFARCRLAEFDTRAQAALNREESEYLAVAAKDLSIDAAEVAHFPLAMVEPGRPLPLTQGVNPAWVDALERFRTDCAIPLLGSDVTELDHQGWRTIVRKLAPFEAWQAENPGAAVESLGLERVETLLAGDLRARLEAAIAEDEAVAGAVAELESVERLTRYYRDFAVLLENYVNFRAFYDREQIAIFQIGTLHLDARTTSLCIEVNDPAKHALLAMMAKTYLAYVELKRPGGITKTVACGLTAGDADNLFVGRNGLFYDRNGVDWDATITKIVDQPISIAQAFWSPYKKLLRWVEEQVAKRAAAADEASVARLQAGAATAGEVALSGAAPSKPKFDVGVIAALGVAVGGITAAIGALLEAFFGLGFWMPLGVLGLILLISGPSMVIAWLKLRQRNLGPILDANGWAVNTLTRINLPLGRMLTDTAELPPGAQRTLRDPYAPKRRRWPWVLLVLVLIGVGLYVAWRLGHLHQHLTFLPEPPPLPSFMTGR